MNRKHMIDATLSFLDEKSPLWSSIAKIGEVKNKLAEVSAGIDVAAKDQFDADVNAGKVKAALKRTICEKADIMNDLVEVYANATGDLALAELMSDSASDLYKMKNDDMLLKVRQIIASATEHELELTTSYGFTNEQLVDLQSDVDQFLEMNGLPREYQIKSGVATLTLEQLFTAATALMDNELDNLMKIFKRRDPSFYLGYQKARMVVDY